MLLYIAVYMFLNSQGAKTQFGQKPFETTELFNYLLRSRVLGNDHHLRCVVADILTPDVQYFPDPFLPNIFILTESY